jgi:UDP-N-acetylmuramyl pentapeptide synthase
VVERLVRPGDVVLVKASRSAQLERVVSHLEKSFAPPAH